MRLYFSDCCALWLGGDFAQEAGVATLSLLALELDQGPYSATAAAVR